MSLNRSETLNLTTMDKDLNDILETHSSVFQVGLGKVEGVKAKSTSILLRSHDTLRLGL